MEEKFRELQPTNTTESACLASATLQRFTHTHSQRIISEKESTASHFRPDQILRIQNADALVWFCFCLYESLDDDDSHFQERLQPRPLLLHLFFFLYYCHVTCCLFIQGESFWSQGCIIILLIFKSNLRLIRLGGMFSATESARILQAGEMNLAWFTMDWQWQQLTWQDLHGWSYYWVSDKLQVIKW